MVTHMTKKTGWKSKRDRHTWRKFLTLEEADFIKETDIGLRRLEMERKAWNKKYGLDRQKIVNRAVQRARFEAGKKVAPL